MFKWLVPVGIVALVAMWAMSTQATLATKNQNVNRSYAQVQNVMQRQAELIPNLVETVKAYAKFEQDTFTQVAEARSKSGGVTNIDASKIANDPALQKQFADAQQSLSGSIGRLLMIQEKYPELKADKGFQDLRTELTGSINRVTVERQKNQIAIQDFNNSLVVFPSNVMASMLGYTEKPYFQADASSQRAPTVKF
jgi:LemA protein